MRNAGGGSRGRGPTRPFLPSRRRSVATGILSSQREVRVNNCLIRRQEAHYHYTGLVAKPLIFPSL
jgi:hypothetical protein